MDRRRTPSRLDRPSRSNVNVASTRLRSAPLVAEYEAGASVAQVARDHVIHITTATANLKRRGVPIRKNLPLTRDEFPRLLELKAQGWTNPQIAVTTAAHAKRYGLG